MKKREDRSLLFLLASVVWLCSCSAPWREATTRSLAGAGAFAARRIALGAEKEVLAPAAQGAGTRRGALRVTDLPVPLQGAISRRLGQDEAAYRFRPRAGGAGVEFANSRHSLHGEHDGRRLLLRWAEGGAQWGLEWRRLGCRTPGGAEVAWSSLGEVASRRAEGNELELDRQADGRAVREWYRNGPLGLQQGFTLEEPPAGCPAEVEEVVVDLAALGGGTPLHMEVEEGRRGITLRQGHGRQVLFRYGGLYAYDRQGRELPAWMEVADDSSLRLHVQAASAEYPVVIDPFVQQAKLLASDGAASDQLGVSVAVDGDTVVVGAPFTTDANYGSVYVFVKPAGGWSGTVNEAAKLVASDARVSDWLGVSVAISGDTVVAGARGDDSASGTDQGSAYVFIKPAGGWSGTLSQSAKLVASDGASSDEFGNSVAISGDTVVVGAWQDDISSQGDRGSAYVFVKPPAGWSGLLTQNAKLTASDGAGNDNFGQSVAISGDTIVVGARNGPGSNHANQGAAYVFLEPFGGWTGTFTEAAKLTASDGAAGDEFGFSVAIFLDTVLVTARYGAGNTNPNQGAAYLFVKPSGGWTGSISETAKLIASDGQGGDEFGMSVALVGNVVAVGARFHDVGSKPNQGAVYVYKKPAAGWGGVLTESAKLVASDGEAQDSFGYGVALSGHTLVVGSRQDDVDFASDQGSAHVFSLDAFCGDGAVDLGEECDLGPLNGQPQSCCAADCTFTLAGTECRAAAGECDAAEVCSGASASCPADVKQPSGTVCRTRMGLCDVAESCDGVSDTCPADLLEPAGVLCRPGSGAPAGGSVCDPDEFCTGTSADCPPDLLQPHGTVCNPGSGDGCDPDEVCSGVPGQACPVDSFAASSVVCRVEAGECDVAEHCPGLPDQSCPADAFTPSGTFCGDATDTDCTNPDTCDGAGSCVANHEPAGTQCWGPDPDSAGPNPLGNLCQYACDGSGQCLSQVTLNCCGNGIVEAGEQCDDGNQYAGPPPAPDGSVESCPSDPAFQCRYVAGASGRYIRGNRTKPARDRKGCQVELVVVNPNNPLDRWGLPDFRQTCVDQDPTCDFDPLPGRCGFITVACVNVADPTLPACSPAGNNGIAQLSVRPLRAALSLHPVVASQYQANLAALGQAITQLFDPGQPSAGFTNQAPLGPGQQDLCSAPRTLTVFAASPTPRESARARLPIRIHSVAGNGRHKRTMVRLTCKARALP